MEDSSAEEIEFFSRSSDSNIYLTQSRWELLGGSCGGGGETGSDKGTPRGIDLSCHHSCLVTSATTQLLIVGGGGSAGGSGKYKL